MFDNCPLHDTSEDWSDGDGPEVDMSLGSRNFRDWPDASLLPLLWDSGSGKGEIEEMGYWLVKEWCTQSEKPGWELVKACGGRVELVESSEDLPFRDVI